MAWAAWITAGEPTWSQAHSWAIADIFGNLLLRPWLAAGLAPMLAENPAPSRLSFVRCVDHTVRGALAALVVLLRVAGLSIGVFLLPQMIYQGRQRSGAPPPSGADRYLADYGGVVGASLSFGVVVFFVWATARAFVAVPIARVERLGLRKSYAESLRRTLGLRWKIVGGILIWAAFSYGGTRLLTMVNGGRGLVGWMWAGMAWDAIVGTPLLAILMCVVDRDLRHGALGPQPAALEHVFE